jgi:hypothetical protein
MIRFAIHRSIFVRLLLIYGITLQLLAAGVLSLF